MAPSRTASEHENSSRHSSSPRLAGLDAVRAIAAALVVMLHAAHAYIPYQMPGLAWPAHDSQPSEIVDAVFWWIEGFIMPLFLFLSGYFALGLFEKLGLRGFLKHRVQRIVYPLVFGCVFILPLDFYAWGVGFALDGRASWRKLRSLKYDPPISDELWGLSHLWYLQYMILYCAVFAVGAALVKRYVPSKDAVSISLETARPANAFRMPMSLASWLIVLWALGSIVLVFAPEVVIGFQHSFFPVAAKFVYSGLFFAGGVIVAIHGMTHLRRNAVLCLGASAACAAFMVVWTRIWFTRGHTVSEQLGYAAITCGFAWSSLLGICGMAMHRTTRLPAAIRYVAEASFWIYLLHHPIVGFTQALLGLTKLPAGVKFVLATGITLTICLATYAWFVRKTWIGALLNGRRDRQPASRTQQPAAEQSRAA